VAVVSGDPVKVSPAEAARRFTMADAEAAGHVLDVAVSADGRLVGDCFRGDERCWSFAITRDRASLESSHVQHAAEATGVCWECSQPEADWPNLERCLRCWLMYHSIVHHLLPRDCPPFLGETSEGSVR